MTYPLVLSALADPTRRNILDSLRNHPRTVTDIAAGQTVSRPAVSQHLRVLEQAGLVVVKADGTRRYYQVNPRGLDSLRSYLNGFWDDVLTAFDAHVTSQTGGSHDGPDKKDH